MAHSITLRTRVLPARRVQVETPEFAAGELVEVLISPALPGPPEGETAEEWIQRFRAWAESHEGLPELAPDAFEREHFYGDRG